MAMFLVISLITFFGLTLLSFLLTALFWDDELYLSITVVLAAITVILFIATGIVGVITGS
ncbi:hypothetical protein CPT_Machias_258 [Staphylococcus phage Machias]|nr:hypothetical protein CPT_Machias_258 [Staphylococcus phage Machias]